jgi:hypothetical protein
MKGRESLPILLLWIAMLFHPLNPAAQTASGSISGAVLFSDGRPVAGMHVIVQRATTENPSGFYSAVTDGTGRYRLEEVRPGSYYVRASGCDWLWDHCPPDAPFFVSYPEVLVITANSAIRDINFRFTPEEVRTLHEKASQLRNQARELWQIRNVSMPKERSEWATFEAMHDYFVAKFVATPGMGSGRMGAMLLEIDPEKRFRTSKTSSSKSRETWTLGGLDLIGIAKHEKPVVFARVSHGAYRLDPRKLTEFETLALTELRNGKETVLRREKDGVLLIGAIRAKETCLKCHAGMQVGDLLGAFRYDLEVPRK